MADLSQMKGRIQMIMTSDRGRESSVASRAVAAALLLAVLVITPVLTAQPDEPENLGRPITLNVRDADLNDVLASFSKISAVEILVESGVTGKVTASFEDVPWDTALFSILKEQGLTWERAGDQIIVRRTEGEKLVPVRPADGEPTLLVPELELPAAMASPAAELEVVHWAETEDAVARAADGSFAAALSTGGTSITLYGRVGDVPIYGCGCYAGPAGAVACTGFGDPTTGWSSNVAVSISISGGT